MTTQLQRLFPGLQQLRRQYPALPPLQLCAHLAQSSPETDEQGGRGSLRLRALHNAYFHIIQLTTVGPTPSRRALEDAIVGKIQASTALAARRNPELASFRAYAEVSRTFKSRAIGGALHEYFLVETAEVVRSSPKEVFLWCYAVLRSSMEDGLKEDCYRQLLREDAQVADMIASIGDTAALRIARDVENAGVGLGALGSRGRGLVRRDLDADSVWGSRSPSPDSAGVLVLRSQSRRRSGSLYASRRGLMPYRRMRGGSAPPSSRRVDEEIARIEDAAELLIELAPELAQRRLRNR